MSRVIFLHGPSSSGKSTLASAVRARSPAPWLHLSLDHFRDSGTLSAQHFESWRDHRAAFFSGMHRSFAAFAETGNNLIVEHILDTPGWHAELQDLLRGHHVLFVGLHTPLEALNAREAARCDRPAGSAAQDFATVHAALTYDLEISGLDDPEANAEQVLEAVSATRVSNFFL